MELKIKKRRAKIKLDTQEIIQNNEGTVFIESPKKHDDILDYQEKYTARKSDGFMKNCKSFLINFKAAFINIINTKKKLLFYIPWLLLIIFFIISFYFWIQLSEVKKTTAGVIDKAEIGRLVTKVGQIILLPEGDLPEVTIVNDLKGLDANPFFANAKIGDDVMIFYKDKKAILYRPSTNMVIEVATVNVQESIPNKDPGGIK